MRIRAITPIRVSEEELERRQRRYERLSPPGLTVDVVNLAAADAPTTLETERDIAVSDRLVAEEGRRTDPARFDAILPDCVLDPGIDALEREGEVPVFGILRLSAGFLAACGRRFAAVTRNRPIGDELVRRLREYRLDPWFEQLVVLDLGFEAVTDDRHWVAALDGVQARLARTPAQALLNGCSAVDVPGRHAVPTLDPTRLALALIAVAAGSGLDERPPAPLLAR